MRAEIFDKHRIAVTKDVEDASHGIFWDEKPGDKARKGYLKACAGQLSPRQAIKAKCLECSGYVWGEVADCLVLACPLWTTGRHSSVVLAKWPSRTV